MPDHAPAPWDIISYVDVLDVVDADGELVCRVADRHMFASIGMAPQNARLIVASPTLLNIVTRYRAQHDRILWPQNRPCDCEICQEAEKIINAVKGKP